MARSSLLLALATLLAACQGARPAEPTASVAGPVRLVRQQGVAAPTAQVVVTGVLGLDAQGCLRLNDRALVWPEDAALDLSQPGAVRVFSRGDGVAVEVGEPVTLLASAPAEPVSGPACAGPQLAVTRFTPAA